MKCWGYNNVGQLGNGTFNNANSPVSVAGISGATAVAAGDHYACALLPGGAVSCWGELSVESPTNRPVAISGLTGATAIAVGTSQACAIVSGGTVKCWGAGGAGQLGNGTNNSSATPVAVSTFPPP